MIDADNIERLLRQYHRYEIWVDGDCRIEIAQASGGCWYVIVNNWPWQPEDEFGRCQWRWPNALEAIEVALQPANLKRCEEFAREHSRATHRVARRGVPVRG